jgi:hypothetical protein
VAIISSNMRANSFFFLPSLFALKVRLPRCSLVLEKMV